MELEHQPRLRSEPPPGARLERSVAPPGTEAAGEDQGGDGLAARNHRRLIALELAAVAIAAATFFSTGGSGVPLLAGLGVLLVVVGARHLLNAAIEQSMRAAGGRPWRERPLPLERYPGAQHALFLLLFVALWALVIANLFDWLWFS